MKRSIVWLVVVAAAGWLPAPSIAADGLPNTAVESAGDCDPVGGLHFVCGLRQPEDLALIPGTRWLITTGMATDGTGGLFLIDTHAKQSQRLQLGRDIRFEPDTRTYPGCPGAPDPAHYSTQGLNLRADGAGRFRLSVVSHGAREAIEAYEVDATADRPTLTWRGCVPLPVTGGNSVTSASDGTLYVTIFMRPGTGFQQMLDGEPTGDLYVWHGGTSSIQRVPGLTLAGANGIELSRDGRTLYLALTGSRDLTEVSVADPGHVLRRADFAALNFAPDNVHWMANGQLISAGMRESDPACGGLSQRQANPQARYRGCHRAAVVVISDPHTLKTRVVYAPQTANPHYTGTSTALVVEGVLWIGSFATDRVAYVPLSKTQRAAFDAH